MIYINNSHSQSTPITRYHTLPYPLTEKGVKQAQRNQSDGIWQMMNWCSETSTSAIVCYYCGINNCQKCDGIQRGDRKTQEVQKGQNQEIQFKRIKANEVQSKQFERSDRIIENNNSERKKRSSRSNKKSVSFNDTGNQNQQDYSNNNLSEQDIIKMQKYQRECYSIQKYLQTSKAYTRTMPNSAIRLFYQKPCLESYGRKNTTGNNGFIYNDYLKTHNVQPHRHENQPKKYQTYRGALNYGKRTKLDPQDRMKRIHRQFASKMDMKALVDDFAIGYVPVSAENLNQTLKYNINSMKQEYFAERKCKSTDNLRRLNKSFGKSIGLGSTRDQSMKFDLSKNDENSIKKSEQIQKLQSRKKRSKSFGKKQYLFLYKYEDKDGDVQYCKDRHGITCYVDPTFDENKQAYKKFLRKIKPIQAEDVKPEDMNIDQQMINNFIQTQQKDVPKHYLVPNCDQPYRPEKYSLKARKKSFASTARTNNEQIRQ